MHALKFKIIEQIVRWKMALFASHLMMERNDLTSNDKRSQYHERIYSLRRELWTWDVPRLLGELGKSKSEETVLAYA